MTRRTAVVRTPRSLQFGRFPATLGPETSLTGLARKWCRTDLKSAPQLNARPCVTIFRSWTRNFFKGPHMPPRHVGDIALDGSASTTSVSPSQVRFKRGSFGKFVRAAPQPTEVPDFGRTHRPTYQSLSCSSGVTPTAGSGHIRTQSASVSEFHPR